MNILAIEPYYDGSHKAFIDGWIAHSRHNFHLLTMPARKWKWRMRGAAIEMAKQANLLYEAGEKFDAVFCCDMLNLAEFSGLLIPELARLKKWVYFHENQITYPCRNEDERDFQYAITNITTAAAAEQVWFNSGYHRDDFLAAAKRLLSKMPDYNCLDVLETIKAKSVVIYPPVKKCDSKLPTQNGVLKIIWAARWEHDKNPEDFFEALCILDKRKIDFTVSVLGQSFKDVPIVFEKAKEKFSNKIDLWGYLPSAKAYQDALTDSDVFVSTASHEFFGISAVEAASAGCCVLLPQRLAYPEVFENKKEFFYDGTVKDLADKLVNLAQNRELLIENAEKALKISKKYHWKENAVRMDEFIAQNVE